MMQKANVAINPPAVPRSPSGSIKSILSLLTHAASFSLFFLVWHVAAVYVVQSVLFPPPLEVFQRAIELIEQGELFSNIAVSLRRIFLGFLLGAAVGVPLGLGIASFATVRAIIEPWTEFLRFIPSVAMITIAVIWFGIGEESKIFLIFYTTVFIVIINTAAGVAAISKNKIRAARVLGATPWQIFFLVSLPGTVPFIVTGMRIAMANSFTTIVAAEMVSAHEGLGVMLWNARLYMQVPDIFVALVSLGVLGLLADKLFRMASAKLTASYSSNS